MKCPSQKIPNAKKKRAGSGSAGKPAHRASKRPGKRADTRKPQKLFCKKHPKIRIKIPLVPSPGNILPTQLHIDYAKILNKNKRTINGVEFAKMNDDACRTRIPFSPEGVRDNTIFQ